MAWNALLMKFLPNTKVEDLSSDFKPQPIGSFDFICEKFYKNFPLENLETYEHYINYSDETGYVEFSIEKTNKVESIGIRSNATVAMLKVMMKVCDIFEVSLLDFQTSEIVENEEMLKESMGKYRSWSNRVLDAYKQ